MGDFSSAWLKNLILRQKKRGFCVPGICGTNIGNIYVQLLARKYSKSTGISLEKGRNWCRRRHFTVLGVISHFCQKTAPIINFGERNRDFEVS